MRRSTLKNATLTVTFLLVIGSAGLTTASAQAPNPDTCADLESSVECSDAAASLEGDASCEHRGMACVAATGTGNASCTGPRCVPVSGTGDTSGGTIAASGTGDAECGTDRFGQEHCPGVAVSGDGCAEGQYEVDRCDPPLAEAPTDPAPSPVDPGSLPGSGHVAVSPDGEANCSRRQCAAVSGTQDAQGGMVAVSGLGDAHGDVVAVSGTGDAEAPCDVQQCSNVKVAIGFYDGGTFGAGFAAGPSDPENFGSVALSGTGNASTCRHSTNCLAVSGTGNATGWAAISGTGNALGCRASLNCLALSGLSTSKGGIAVSPVAPANGDEVGVSGAGDARGYVLAVSGTGSAEGGLVAVSATGPADGGTVALSGCDAAGICADPVDSRTVESALGR